MARGEVRKEHDGMGALDVPADALWGAQTQRAIDNFRISGLALPRRFLEALGLVKWAAARANGDVAGLDPRLAEAIGDSALEVSSGQHDGQFPVDVFQTGSGTSTNMNANEVIATLAGRRCGLPVHPNDHVNMSQSSNDVVPTTIHVAAALGIKGHLVPAFATLRAAIDARVHDIGHVPKTGRTHLMDAVPLTLGQELGGWRQQIDNAIERVRACEPRLHRLALGGTAVGTGLNAPHGFAARAVELLAGRTGLPFVTSPDYFESLAAQDAAVELSGQLKVVAVSLMKIANDLRWMNSGPLAGLGEITLKALQPGSSIMPGKVNPVVPEAVAMVAAQVIGNDATVTVAGQSGNFQLNVMLPVVAYNLLQSVELLGNAATALAGAMAGFTVNEPRLAAALERNPILATALNRLIGYEQGSAIVKRAYRESRPIKDVAAEMTQLSREELDRLLDPVALTGSRDARRP
jgi:fumarate hydratase class II